MPWARGFLPAVGLVVALQVALAVGTGWPAATGVFWGPDSYMRLARTLACEGGAACPGAVFTGTNAPFGEVIHWPFLQDRLLLALAAPLSVVLDAQQAVLTAASLFGPLLGVAGLALILLIARAIVAPPGLYFVGVLLACQPWVFQAFAAPQADHHGLQGVLFLGMVAGSVHVVAGALDRRWAALAGASLGLALWVSTEALVSALPILLALAVLWLARGGRDAARANRDVAMAAVVVLTLGLLVDGPPGGRLAVEYDRFSVVHWIAFALMAATWRAVELLHGGLGAATRNRLAIGFVSLIAWAGATAALFPDFFAGPMVDMDPRLAPVWLDRTSEFIPVSDQGRPMVVSLHLASSLLAIPAAVVCVVWGDRAQRAGWSFLLGASLWFAALTIFLHGRWALYLHLLVPIPLAWLLGEVIARTASVRATPLLRTAFLVGAVSLIATFPLIVAVPLARAEARAAEPAAASTASCSAAPLVPYLRELERDAGGAGIVLAPADWGPEIVFRTGHRAVASPYHRNAGGLLDSHTFMSTAEPHLARAIATERRIDWVVTCSGQPWFPVVEADAAGSLYASLSGKQEVPDWLRAVTLPAPLERSFRVFEVVGGPERTR